MGQDAFDVRFWAIVARAEPQLGDVTAAVSGASTRTVRRLVLGFVATGVALGTCATATGRPWWLAVVGVIYVVPASAWVSVLVVDGITSTWDAVRTNLLGPSPGSPARARS